MSNIDHYLREEIHGRLIELKDSKMKTTTFEDDILVSNMKVTNLNEIGGNIEEENKEKTLLALYRKLGSKVFSMLDGKFAIVIYDSRQEKVVASRDKKGKKSLYYGYSKYDGKILFSSDRGTLVERCKDISSFPCGHNYKNGIFIKW